jgi:multiple sugar transport system substrate-binding protein
MVFAQRKDEGEAMNTGNRPTADLRDLMLQRKLNRRTLVGGGAALGLGAGLSIRGGRVRAQDKVQIRLATWAGVEEAAELQTVVDKVNQEATDFEIISEPNPADYYTKLQTTIAGGAAADLFWLSQEFVAGYADRGALLDLSDRLAADETPAADLTDYVPAILQTAQYDDATFGLPWISQPVVLYYNPELFAAAGVAEPDDTWTWDTFKTNAAALTDSANGVYGTSFNGWPPIQMFIWQAGGEVITEDLSECPIDSPEAIEAADFYASIVYNEEYAPSEATITEQGFGEMAKAGKIAMFFGGAADDLDYAHKKDPKNALLKVALVPQGPKSRTTFAWTAATVVNAKAENPDVAYQALVALTEGIHHWKIVAPRTSLASADVIAASVPDKADSAETILKAVPDMRSFHIIPDHAEWDTTFTEVFLDPLFHGEGSAEELAPDARAELETLLP